MEVWALWAEMPVMLFLEETMQWKCVCLSRSREYAQMAIEMDSKPKNYFSQMWSTPPDSFSRAGGVV